ncbi:MAG: 50S ribosomal protein L25/general stress protein Ctc [Gammaproteobacteria bacterium]
MADKFELTAEPRQESGKGAIRRLRRLADKVPAIVYGAGKAPLPISLSHNSFNNALKNQAFYSHILTLKLGNSQEKVVLKALQRHPSKPRILHADFLRILANEKLTMLVPLQFINEETAPGIKLEGGVLTRLLNEVEVRCLPADLPEGIEVDLAEVGLDQYVHLSQLKLPAGVELVALAHEDDKPVAHIHQMQELKEPEPEVEASAEVPLVGEEGEEGEGAESAEGEEESKPSEE